MDQLYYQLNLRKQCYFHYYKNSIVYVNSIDNMIGSIIYYLENNNKYEEKIKNIQFIENTEFIEELL